jgi:hypothetical protein
MDFAWLFPLMRDALRRVWDKLGRWRRSERCGSLEQGSSGLWMSMDAAPNMVTTICYFWWDIDGIFMLYLWDYPLVI